MDYRQAAEFIKQKRRTQLLNAGALFDALLKDYPALYKIETDLRTAQLEGVKTGKPNDERINTLKQQKADFLKSLNITDAMLSPPPSCKHCKDTGLIKNNQFCSCVKNTAISSENNIKIALNGFEKINYGFYCGDDKERNKTLIENCKKIAEMFPANKRRNLLVLGPTGTGKTLLAGCVAQTVLSRGFSVTSLSAFDFTNRALSYHTTFDDNKQSYLNPILDSSLLVIDDLGTEPILKNVTLEYLYIALNERMGSEKLTLITTNLSKDALLSRYGERIYSRLFDKELSYVGILYGDDVRSKNR